MHPKEQRSVVVESGGQICIIWCFSSLFEAMAQYLLFFVPLVRVCVRVLSLLFVLKQINQSDHLTDGLLGGTVGFPSYALSCSSLRQDAKR